MLWSSAQTLNFIEDLHSNRCLWDPSFAEYRNREIKNKCLLSLATKYQVSSPEIEKKIHTLKGQFRREHRKMKSLQSGTSPQKCNWFGYEPLLFLTPVVESRGSRNTDEESQVSEIISIFLNFFIFSYLFFTFSNFFNQNTNNIITTRSHTKRRELLSFI